MCNYTTHTSAPSASGCPAVRCSLLTYMPWLAAPAPLGCVLCVVFYKALNQRPQCRHQQRAECAGGGRAGGGGGGGGGRCAAELYSGKGDPGSLKNLPARYQGHVAFNAAVGVDTAF